MAGFFESTPERVMRTPLYDPSQMQAFSDILQSGMQGLKKGTSSMFDPMRSQAMANFRQQTVPGLAQMFSGMGGEGTRLGSSGFAQALGGAGADLESQLNSQQLQYLMQLLGMGLTQKEDIMYQPEQQSQFMDLMKILGPAAINAATAFGTGGMSLIPGAIGAGSSLFSGLMNPQSSSWDQRIARGLPGRFAR